MDKMERFTKDRNSAMIAAVMRDDWDAVTEYCKKYKVPIPKNESVMKAGIYKAVQEIISIPQEVKDVASAKCIMLGFKPAMRL